MTESKRDARLRRAARGRRVSERDQKIRLVVHRTGQHIYAQLVTPDAKVLTSASTAEKEVRGKFARGNTIKAATAVGEHIAQKAKKAKIDSKVVFDRSGFKYHGRIKALAEGARSGGLEF